MLQEDTAPVAAMDSPSPNGKAGLVVALVLGAVLVGAFFRSVHLTGQVLLEDEVHALTGAIHHHRISDVVSTFGEADRSIPLVLWDKLLMGTVGLDELGLRLPMWFAGVLALVVFPLLVCGEQNRRTTILFAWLLALSPVLVFYSRMARPYMIAIHFGFVAVLAFRHWFETGRRAAAILYVACTALTGWLLIVFLPFVLGPFVCFGAWAALRGSRRDLVRLVKLGGATVIGMAVPLGLPLWSSFGHLTSKAQVTPVHMVWGILPRALRGLLCGSSTPLAVLLVLFLLYGWATARRPRDKISMEDYLAFLAVLHLAAVLVVGPVGIASITALGRYLLPLTPCALLLVAAGLGRAFERRPQASSALGVAVVVAVIAGSELTAIPGAPAGWATYFIQQRAFARRNWSALVQTQMGPFYQELSRLPPRSRVIAELPAHAHVDIDVGARYQLAHRQEVVFGRVEGLCDMGRWMGIPPPAPGLRLRTLVHMDAPEAVARRGVSHAVLHRTPFREAFVHYWEEAEMGECLEHMQELYGPPVHEDGFVVVYEVRAPKPQ
jgi:hypothetical protein